MRLQDRSWLAILLLPFVLCVLANPLLARTQQSKAETATLLVDTDDVCHFFIDDEDKGQLSPDKSQKFTVGLGEHILKCKNDTIPDLVWRKVIEAKDSTQVAAAISLKALHLQYDQAVASVKTNEAAEAKKLVEAEAEEKERATAKAEFPKQLFDVVKGSWANSRLVGSFTAVETTIAFQDLDASRGALTFSLETTAKTSTVAEGRLFGNGRGKEIVAVHRTTGYFTPSPPNRLQGTLVECSKTDVQAAKGVVKFIPCSADEKGFSPVILVLSKDQLQLLMRDQELLLTRKAQ